MSSPSAMRLRKARSVEADAQVTYLEGGVLVGAGECSPSYGGALRGCRAA